MIKAAVVGLTLPLDILWSTGNVQNTVAESGNPIDGRQVAGTAAIRDHTPDGAYELAAANAHLNVHGPLGLIAHVQFLTKELRVPSP